MTCTVVCKIQMLLHHLLIKQMEKGEIHCWRHTLIKKTRKYCIKQNFEVDFNES